MCRLGLLSKTIWALEVHVNHLTKVHWESKLFRTRWIADLQNDKRRASRGDNSAAAGFGLAGRERWRKSVLGYRAW